MNTLNIRFAKAFVFDDQSTQKIVVMVSDDQSKAFFEYTSIAETLIEIPDIAQLCFKIADLRQFDHLKFKMRPGLDPELEGGQIKVAGYSEMMGSKGATVLPIRPKT